MARKLYMECRLYNVNDRLAVLDITERIESLIADGTLVDMADCFLPYRNGSNADVDDEEGVFKLDIDALEECTGVAGFMDGMTYDPGCAFEIGCGYAWGYPIHLLTTDIYRWFAGDTSDPTKIYPVSKLMEHIAKIVYMSDLDTSIEGYRARNEDLRERAINEFLDNLIEEYGTAGPEPVKMEALPVVYDYYLDPSFKYTEKGRELQDEIIAAIKKAGKTFVVGDVYGDIAAQIDILRASGQAIIYSDAIQPNVDTGILQGIAYGIGRKPLVYSSSTQRYYMAGKYVSYLNTMIYFSAEAVVTSLAELEGKINRITSVQDATKIAAEQALQASCQGTFCVGGLLIDKNGNVIHQLHNNVVKNDKTFDPTAHGERQLIDWYYENREALSLPEPEDIILVTSLDPCVMCTGSIMESGFSSAVISANDTFAGINYDETATFPSLQGTSMLSDVLAKFSYPKAEGETACFTRAAQGAPVPELFGDNNAIEEQTFALTRTVFSATLSEVSEKINTDLPEEELLDPATLDESHPVYVALKALYPDALTYKAPTPGVPDEGLAPYLIAAAEQDLANGGEGNAVALLDSFGNLILCVSGNQGISGIQTPFMIATRSYAQLRYNLQMEGVEDTPKYLGHPKYNAFIYAKSIQVNPRGLADLGAFGSTMEGAIPTDREQFQYGVARESQEKLQSLCDNLPPFYSSDESVNVHVSQVTNQALIEALEAGLPK